MIINIVKYPAKIQNIKSAPKRELWLKRTINFHPNDENLEYNEFDNIGPGKSLHLIPK